MDFGTIGSVNEMVVEQLHRRALVIRREPGKEYVAEQGFRAAKARDPKLMVVLEKCAETMVRMNEHQHGQTQRSTKTHAEKFPPQEVKMWQEAYRCADAGDPVKAFAWIYGVAAQHAGLVA